MGQHNIKDVWKPLAFCSGKYQVSSLGKVKSVYSLSKNYFLSVTNTILKTEVSKRGYEVVKLTWCDKNGKQYKKNFFVHRLVALSFIPNPENKLQVNHKDCNKLNNFRSNLEWCTSKENVLHAQAMGRSPIKKKISYTKKNIPRKIRFKCVININTNETLTVPMLSERIGRGKKYVYMILSGKIPNPTEYRYQQGYIGI